MGSPGMTMKKQNRRDCLKGMMAVSAASLPLLKTLANGAPAPSRTETEGELYL